MIYNIKNKNLTVSISDVGAEITSVIYNGRERSWQNENGSWARHAPVLFPVCGNSSVIINGKDLGMGFHGFVRDSVFTCVFDSEDSVIFRLKHSAETLKVYPFEFELTIGYFLSDNAIRVENTVKNEGNKVMPFALGRHDSFSLEKDVYDYELVFSKTERFLSQRTDNKGKLISEFDDFGCGKVFCLPADFLTDGKTVIFKNVESRSVTLREINGKEKADFSFADISNILIWRPDGAKMICIEPWSSPPDDSGDTREFGKGKPYYLLNAGESKKIEFVIKYY